MDEGCTSKKEAQRKRVGGSCTVTQIPWNRLIILKYQMILYGWLGYYLFNLGIKPNRRDGSLEEKGRGQLHSDWNLMKPSNYQMIVQLCLKSTVEEYVVIAHS